MTENGRNLCARRSFKPVVLLGQNGGTTGQENAKISYAKLEAHVLKHGKPKLESGRQEFLENLINDFI